MSGSITGLPTVPDLEALWSLLVTFGVLSLLAVGGGTAVLPPMEQAMAGYGIDSATFLQIYGLGQLAPGPNMLMVVVLGDRIAGPVGAFVALFAFFLPAAALALVVGRLWDRIGESPWRRAIQDGLAPVSIGLMAGGILAVARHAISGPVPALLAVAVLALMLRTRVNAALLTLAAAVVGAVFLNA